MKTYFLMSAAVLFAAACQSPAGETDQSSETAELTEAEPDIRQGAEVNRICFRSQIRGWREHDRRSVIVEKGVREEFKLDLIGTCDPRDAFLSIGLVSTGGLSCLQRGDRLVTDDSFGGRCSIRRIYEWDEDAGEEVAEEASAS